MSLLENVMVGAHSRTRAGLVSAALRPPSQRREEQRMRTTAEECLDHPGFTSGKMSFVLPSKYQGKFTDGGVLIQLTGSMEIDYIDISSIH
jgi:hypothetical protein